MKKAFTIVEMLLAILLMGVMSAFAILTFNSVASSWEISNEYMDKMQRTDYALDQVISSLRSLYYPHEGSQDERYGFQLEDNGDGENPRKSDVIYFSKLGTALGGSESSVADTVQRVQLMILEEGNNDYKTPIQKTGLYVRECPDAALQPSKSESFDEDISLANNEMYEPILVADGILGMNCRVVSEPGKTDGENDKKLFEDEWATSNAVPYKVELTFRVADKDEPERASKASVMMRIIDLPMYEQSKDGASLAVDDAKNQKKKTSKQK